MSDYITIARPYAEAAFDFASDKGEFAAWSGMLALAAAVAANPTMCAQFDNPRLTKQQLAELFLDVCGEQLDAHAGNLIRLMADNGRLAVLPELYAEFERLRAEAERTLQAQVVSAKPVSESQKAAIAAALKARLGREVTLECVIDETLLGGAIIRAGDLVIDGSAKGRLSRLATAMNH